MAAERNRQIIWAAGAGLAQRVTQLAATFLTLPLVLHRLGIAGFGIWGAASSLAWLTGMLDLGLGSALVTLLPRSLAAERAAEARGFIGASLFGALVLGAALAIVGGAAVLALASNAARAPLLLAVIGLAVNVPLGLANNIWFGLQKGFWAGFWEFQQTVLTVAFLLLALALRGGALAMVGAVYAAMLLANAGSSAHLFWSHPRMRPGRPRGGPSNLASVLRPGGWLFGVTAAMSCLYMFDNLLALHWLGAAVSAPMTIALRLCTTAVGMIAVITQPLWPAFVDAAARGDAIWAARTLRRGGAAVAVLAGAGALAIGMFGAPLLRWWLRADIAGPGLLWTCAAWVFALSVTRVPALLFNAFSVLRFQLAVLVVTLALATALKIWLAPIFGAGGILGATAIACVAVMWPAYAWRLARMRQGSKKALLF
jgi:O-antigen/teichoic acid export membrane protein